MRTRLSALSLSLLGGAVLMTGCVSQSEYDNVAETNMTYESRLEELHQQNKALQTMVDRKQSRIDELESEVSSLRATKEELNEEISEIRGQQRNLRDRLGNLSLTMLDPDLDRALRNLAESNPDLIAYDPSLGMVRFTSDLTFPSGSDQVKPEAKEGLRKLADILLQVDAPYEVHVVGHTDSQRISNPATKRKHPTNRHLSVHRSIGVSEALQSFGVPADRVLVAGWGQYRPAVPNNPSGGTAENRRVEIFLVGASDYSGTSMSGTGGEEAQAETPTDEKYPMK